MGVGSYLRKARERRQLTVVQVAQRIKIDHALISDLESGDMQRWPKARVYRHGYLRAYAELLGLDPLAVTTRFDDEFGDLHPVAFHERRLPAAKPLPFHVVSRIVLGTAIVIMLGGVVSVLMSGDTVGVDVDEVFTIESRPLVPVDVEWTPITLAARAEEVAGISADTEGELRILSNPPRAHVTINGIGRGATPLRVRYLPPGPYTIRVIQVGYRIGEARVTLSPDEPRRTVRVALRDNPQGGTNF
jgi:transcriptional regulator with XRE-family HTH domain